MPDANHNASPDSTCHAASSTPHSAPAAERLSAAGLPLQKRWLSIIAVIWAGQAVSMITSYAAGYAVVWYVTETTESALLLSIMTACVMLPIGLISPFGGLVADRHNRKLIMIVADGAVGLVSLAARPRHDGHHAHAGA